MKVDCRNGEIKEYWAFTKTVRLKRYGRKRLVIVHEKADLSDPPRYLLTSAKHWNSGRTIQTWSYPRVREDWACEVFHEFARGKTTFGQRCRTIAREIFRSMLELSKRLFADGRSCGEVLDMLMPA